jgi:hypothetical protein
MQANAASNAADEESNAAMSAANLQHQSFEQASGYLSPYVTAGTNNLNLAQGYMASNGYLNGSTGFNPGSAGIPYANSQGAFSFNGSDLANTPGYQFQLQQGENAVNNAQSASGLNVSGAQQKAMASYVTGLADTTYNQQFQNQLNAYTSSYGNALNAFNTNYNVAANQYNRYSGLAQQGLTAGQSLAQAATGTAQAQGQAIMGAGQAQAAGTVGSANALAGAVNGIGSGYLTSQVLGSGNALTGLGSAANSSSYLPAVDTTGTYDPYASSAISPNSLTLAPVSG